MENDTRIAGPGAIPQTGEQPTATLDGASEYEYVDVLNPLSVAFAARFATTKPVNAPVRIGHSPMAPGITTSEADMKSTYGLDLRNPDHTGNAHVTHDVVIEAGKVKRFLGNEAQVVVRQLIVEIMSRREQKRLIADPTARAVVEAEIIIGRGFVQDVLGRSVQTVSEQLNAIKEPEDANEDQGEFAGLNTASAPLLDHTQGANEARVPSDLTETDSGSRDETTGAGLGQRRSPGRPRKQG